MQRSPRSLTIAGSDSGGGAGLEADLKTFTVFGVYGSAVVTGVTAQNTMKVSGIHDIPPEFVELQIDAVLSDIGADSVKTGMLFNRSMIETVSKKLEEYDLKAVVDPVMVTKKGDLLLKEDAVELYRNRMMKRALVVTPNIREAEVLTGSPIKNINDMEEAAEFLHDIGAEHAVIKAGLFENKVVDVYFDGTDFQVIEGELLTGHKHGTGCTFSAAITAMLALGSDMDYAVRLSKKYVEDAIRKGVAVGKGEQPVNHNVWSMQKDFLDR